MMKNIRFVLFDCDGVLIDSEIIAMQMWINFLAEHNITINQTFFVNHFLGRKFEQVQKVLKDTFNFTLDKQMSDEFTARLKADFERRLTATPHIKLILETITVPYVLATSSSRERTQFALSSVGLTKYFGKDQIFTGADVENGKPAPDLFLHAMRSHSMSPSECLVIEDSRPGLLAAKAAKMHCLQYVGGGHINSKDSVATNVIADWRDFARSYPHLFSK